MNRTLLIGIALGAAMASAARFGASQFKQVQDTPSAKMRVYELSYQRPRDPVPAPFEGIPDPLVGTPTQAVAQLAAECDVREYKLQGMDQPSMYRAPAAYLTMDPAKISDGTFNCLTERLRPPYLSLSVFERCRWAVENNPAAPPCKEPQE